MAPNGFSIGSTTYAVFKKQYFWAVSVGGSWNI